MDPAPITQPVAISERISKFDGYRGNIIGLWACVESAMDRANHYAWWYSDKAVAEAVPVSLRRKIKLFKEINRDLAPFAPLREQAERLSWAIDSLYDDRHWLAHGYITPEEPDSNVWVIEKHEFPKKAGGLITASRTFTEADLEVLRLKMIILVHEFGAYLNTLGDQVAKHLRDNTAG